MASLPSRRDEAPLRQALRIGLIYVLVSALWIYFSDLAVEQWIADPAAVRGAQTWKGWAFVFLSGLLIVYLVKRALDREHRTAERLHALLDQSLVGIYLIRGGRLLYANPRFAQLFGYGSAETMVESVPVAELVAEDDRDLVLGNLALREQGRERDIRYRFTARRSDGERFEAEVHGTAVRWEGENAVLGVIIDVDERERLEEQVREAQRMEAMGKLTGQIAHDFNNFLTAIIGPLDLCVDRLPDGSEERKEAEEARRTAVRAADLSRKLLAFSKSRPSVPRVLDLGEKLEEMRPLLLRLVGSSVEVRVETADGPVRTEMDPSDLEQVVMNLALNAGEAIEGSGTVELRAGRVAGPAPGQVWLEVQDDGTGMDAETQEQVFEPFFTTKPEGTGLGLASVRGIVEQMGGEVTVKSEEGAGTLFRVLLPEVESEPEPEPRGPAPERTTGDGECVLVVEDEPAVRWTVTRALQRFGYRVLEAEDGETAIEIAGRADVRVDLLFTDVSLPDSVGPEVADRVAQLQPRARILFTSGFSDEEVSARLSGTPDVRIIEKPFRIDQLLRAVRDALDSEAASSSAVG